MQILHVNIPSRWGKYNGFTLAYKGEVNPGKNTRMVKVAVSYCSVNDEYSADIGTELVKQRMSRGELIQLPLGDMLKHRKLELETMLTQYFSF